MKAIRFKIVKQDRSTILRQTDDGPHFYDRLHYHPEFQITVVIRGEGIVYGGRNPRNFSPGDVFFFGENMPHLFKCSTKYYTGDSPGVLSYSLFFNRTCLGDDFFGMKEMKQLNRFLTDAGRGFIYPQNEALGKKIIALNSLTGERLILQFIDLLVEAMEAMKEYLNEEVFNPSLDEQVGERLNRILKFTFESIHEKIKVEDAAAIANLSKSQFSRYFKRHTGKTFIRFVNELRVEEARRLLEETDRNVEDICYACGFQNVSNFNRQFKGITSVTPRAYRVRLGQI